MSKLPELIKDDHDSYTKVPVDGRTEILANGIESKTEYYSKNTNYGSLLKMISLGNYTEINEKNRKPLEDLGFDVTGKKLIFAKSYFLNQSIEKGEKPDEYWIHEIEPTAENLYTLVPRDRPIVKTSDNAYMFGGRRRRNSKKRNTKRRNSMRGRSYRRR